MPTLEQLRRANGDRIENERRANGDRIEQARRAGGDRLIEERTGRSVAEDINRLVTPPKSRRSLPTVPPVGPLPASQGRGVYERKGRASSGGMASPLTETGERIYHPAVLLTTTDGIFTLQVQHVAQLHMTDVDGTEHEFNYQNPDA